MKYLTFSIVLLLIFSCANNGSTQPNSKEYDRAKQLVIQNQENIFKIVANSRPEIKDRMTYFLNLCLENNEQGWLKKSGKDKTFLAEFFKMVDFFVGKIEKAKSFKPDDNQIALYNKLKEQIEKDRKIINGYINAKEMVKNNNTDIQRIRMYEQIMNNDIESYLSNNILTKEEFDKNFQFLTENWKKLIEELRPHFD